ncbi:MAG: helix-turn-helix transcriptional regulator [Ruminococcus sp.]|nr:helix-turn-helix transcriptional regulator [Ruminococcus sp.]MCM1392134.1 helix-turn-helix transcriptional regulator [Ruminococcus sp.]
MNNYKFGNYICQLREEHNMTQAGLAEKIGVSDKAVSKWENGQAFPRIETFEKLAHELDTTVEDIYLASKDGIKRICIANNFYSIMHIDINGQLYSIRADESKWIEIDSDTAVIKLMGKILTEDDYNELDESVETLKDRITVGLIKKFSNSLTSLVLQTDCTYRISNITSDILLSVDLDGFDLGDKTLIGVDFMVAYPKITSTGDTKIELLHARGQNTKEVIKKYKRIGLFSDLGLGFVTMLLSYPLRGMYFKHLCKPRVLKKNIINADKHKQKSEKRNNGRKVGCLGTVLISIAMIVIFFLFDALVLDVIFVDSRRPALVAADYSTITLYDDVYVRIDNLPEDATESVFSSLSMWENARTDGLSKWNQSSQDERVKCYKGSDGTKYLWLVEDYFDTVHDENGEELDWWDFDEHYVYVCENSR